MKRARIKQCPTCLGEAVVYEGHAVDELRGGSYQRWMPCPNRECDDGWIDDPNTASVRPLLYAIAVVVIVVMALMAGLHQSAPRSSPDPTASQPGASGAIAAPGGIVPARATVGASGRSSSGAPSVAVGAPLPAAAPEPLEGWATVDEGQGPGHAAAGPALRKLLGGDPAFRGDVVTVTSKHGSVTVRLTDFCACGLRHGKPTIIDLDETDFRTLTGRGPGVEWVVISSATSSIALPATDTIR